MTTWAIGDIQGCFDSLRALLERVGHDPARDSLWLVGDLVNRGPKSLETLRFLRDLSSSGIGRVQVVLGNHDIHLLGLALGVVAPKRSDTLADLLEAPDAHELIEWLARQPLIADVEGFVLVHAGIPPQWSVAVALERGRRAAARLADPQTRAGLLRRARTDAATQIADTDDDELRDAQTLSALTRIRVCDRHGHIDHSFKDTLKRIPKGLHPWYAVPGRVPLGARVVFGHWAAHAAAVGDSWVALDSGCVWGQKLTAWSPHTNMLVAVDACDGR